MPLTPEHLIAEQIEHLRKLTHFYAQKAMGGSEAELKKLLDTQTRLVDLIPYMAGYQLPEAAPLEAPPPVLRAPAPPLRFTDEDDVVASATAFASDEDGQRPAVTWPPEPLFGAEEREGEHDPYGEER
jgi:hypothetical protein